MPLIEVGSDADFADSLIIREMKDYRTMSRAELLTWIGELKSRHARRNQKHRRQAADAVLEHAERLRAILNTAVEGIITIDHAGLIESMNPAAEKIFGYPAAELLGQNVSRLMPQRERAVHDGYIANYLRTGHAKIIGLGREVCGQRKDGTVFPMELSVSEVRLKDRVLFTGFVRDISRRQEAEKVLRHYAALVESSEDAIIGKTLDGYIMSWNRGAENIFGYPRAEAISQHISLLIPEDRRDEEPAILEKIRRGEAVDHYETVRRRKDGQLIDVSVTISPIRDEDGRITGASKLARDITGRKRLEREVLEVSDREQRRIGHDLHDGLCQHLAGIEMMSQVLEKKLAHRSREGAARAADIARHVRDAISQTRALARGLSPATLESEGLSSALQEHALATEKMFGLRCRFACDLVPATNHAMATHLFRLAQEAVSNAVKHGRATEITLQLQGDPGGICLSIADNGVGFTPRLDAPATGMGLRIMQFRARMIGGTLTIERNPGGGTVVRCAAPLPAATANPPPP